MGKATMRSCWAARPRRRRTSRPWRTTCWAGRTWPRNRRARSQEGRPRAEDSRGAIRRAAAPDLGVPVRGRRGHAGEGLPIRKRGARGQCRKSGEPFVGTSRGGGHHPGRLAHGRGKTLCAALLHDTVEDTSVTRDQVEAEFNPPGGTAGGGRDEDHAHRGGKPHRRAGRHHPQDVRSHEQGHPRHRHQAGRPPAQHAHAGRAA